MGKGIEWCLADAIPQPYAITRREHPVFGHAPSPVSLHSGAFSRRTRNITNLGMMTNCFLDRLQNIFLRAIEFLGRIDSSLFRRRPERGFGVGIVGVGGSGVLVG